MLAVQAVDAAAGGATGPSMILRTVLPAILAVAGLSVALIGWFGLRERLRRNRWAGVRTPATMRDEDAFRLANRVAGMPLLAAGVIGVISAALAAAMPSTTSLVIVLVVGALGLGALAVSGGALGHRAAAALPEPAPTLCTAAVKQQLACAPGGGCAGCAGKLCALKPADA